MWLWFNLMWYYIKVIYMAMARFVQTSWTFLSFPFCAHQKKDEKKIKKKDLIKSFTVNVVINFRPHAINWLLPAQKFDEKVIAYNYTLWDFYLSVFFWSWNYPAFRLILQETQRGGEKKPISLSLTGQNVFSRLFYPMPYLLCIHIYSKSHAVNMNTVVTACRVCHVPANIAHSVTHTILIQASYS